VNSVPTGRGVGTRHFQQKQSGSTEAVRICAPLHPSSAVVQRTDGTCEAASPSQTGVDTFRSQSGLPRAMNFRPCRGQGGSVSAVCLPGHPTAAYYIPSSRGLCARCQRWNPERDLADWHVPGHASPGPQSGHCSSRICPSRVARHDVRPDAWRIQYTPVFLCSETPICYQSAPGLVRWRSDVS